MAIPKVVGIENVGNSCFMAATLQMVAHTPGVRETLARHKLDVFLPLQLYISLPAFVRGYSLGQQFDAMEFFELFVARMRLSGADIEPIFRAEVIEKLERQSWL
nr:hypothetical protein CFP56_67243 [Quercus suber]